jgi:hypothetical protein
MPISRNRSDGSGWRMFFRRPRGGLSSLSLTDESSFHDVCEWLDAHEGQRAMVEIGCRDSRDDFRLADFAVMRVHTMLGAIQMVEDRERGTGVLRVPFGDGVIRQGIDIDQACFRSASVYKDLLKVWQQDVFITICPIEE